MPLKDRIKLKVWGWCQRKEQVSHFLFYSTDTAYREAHRIYNSVTVTKFTECAYMIRLFY